MRTQVKEMSMTVLPLYWYHLAPHSSPQHNYSQFIYSKHSHLRIAAVLFLWGSPKSCGMRSNV